MSLANEAKKKDTPKRRAIVYFADGPNGILLKAEDNKEDIEELNQWIRMFLELPKGKYYEFGVFVIPHNEWPEYLTSQLYADFNVKPLSDSYGWTTSINEVEVLKSVVSGLGLEYQHDDQRGRFTVFLL
jgi:hypothetical protein